MTSFESINRFFYFSMNYAVNHYDWADIWGDKHSGYLPDFIMKVDWSCSRTHMINKWRSVEDNFNAYSRMNAFYADIDNDNRQRLVDWIMENYHE